MFSALLSFLGGSVFRMIWGEVSSYLSKKQDHTHELELIRLTGQLEAEKHARELEAIKVQADLGVKMVRVQGEMRSEELDRLTFQRGVELTGQTTGFKFVDAWNSSIRAALATMMMVLIALHYHRAGWVLDQPGWELAGAILGLYTADRMLFRRGK